MGLVRSWLIRGLILAILAGIISSVWVMHDWVSPDRVREALIAALREQFPEADVQVGSAHLRIFGGISVRDLKLTRPGESAPFFETPSAVISHDKEQLSSGRLVLRKVELDSPTIRVVRGLDGKWNLAGVSRPASTDRPVPTVVIKNATVIMQDLRPGGIPPLAVIDGRIHVINDPQTTLKVEVQGTVTTAHEGVPQRQEGSLALPFNVTGRVHRATLAVAARVEVPDLPIGPDMAPALAKIDPTLAEFASQFTAHVAIRADLTTPADANKLSKYDLRLEVREGRWECDHLPFPVEHMAATVRVQDGRIGIEKGTARIGKSNVEFNLETRDLLTKSVPTRPDDPMGDLEDRLDRLDFSVRDLPIEDELFSRLPEKAREKAAKIKKMFSPTGSVDVGVKFTRGPDGGWRREVDIRPNRIRMVYDKFRYPVQDVTGVVKKIDGSDGTDEFRVQLSATGAGRRVEISGRVSGDGPDPLIDLKIAGTDIPIDDQVFGALPPRYAAALKKLRAKARGDFVVEIRQPLNVNRCENTFRVRVYDGELNYVHFPYPVTKVRGSVTVQVVGVNPARPIRPGHPVSAVVDEDRVDLADFEALHAGGRLWLPMATNSPMPETPHRKLSFRVLGENCPLDEDLRASVAAMKLDGAWNTFSPRGRLTFGADVEIIDRGASSTPTAPTPVPMVRQPVTTGPLGILPVVAALPGEPPFDPAADLTLTVNFQGPSVTPNFFPYDLDQLAGVLRYQGGKVDLARFTARHQESKLALEAGEIRFGPVGEIWANLGNLTMQPIVVDEDLIDAFPPRVRSAVERLKLRGPLSAHLKHLVVQVPGDGPIDTSAVPSLTQAAPKGVQARAQAPSLATSPVSTRPDPIVYWNGEFRLGGAAFDTGIEWTDVHGVIASVGRYEGTHLGSVLGNLWFDRATIAKQPLQGTKVSYRIRPQEPLAAKPGTYGPVAIEFPDVTATYFQGTLGGEARIVLEDNPRYRLFLTGSGIQLDELARHLKPNSGAELRGMVQGRILLENQPDPASGQSITIGSGVVDVPSGRMYNLPILLPLLKLLKLQAPDQTAFEEAHASFEIRGDRMTITQLDLIGTAVSLGGSGEMDLAGEDVRFEFYTIWSQALKRWLTTPFGDVTSFLSGNLFKIEMTKTKAGEMQYRPHMLPVVTEPVRVVAERLRNRMGRPGETTPAARPPAPR